jgi:hypothetical protein
MPDPTPLGHCPVLSQSAPVRPADRSRARPGARAARHPAHRRLSDQIGGAALDVTDPEPLPAGHPLWGLPNCLITPHTADTEQMTEPLLAARIAANVRRFAAGHELEGQVDPDLGY